MSVSVSVGTHNFAPWVEEAIDGLHAQTLRPAEVVLVDAASTDATVALAERSLAGLDGVTVARLSRNFGVAGPVRNAGVALTSGAYVAFLDGDDWWAPHFLATAVAALDDTPEAAMTIAQGQVVHADGSHRFVMSPVVVAGQAPLPTLLAPPESVLALLRTGVNPSWTPSQWVIRRAVLEHLGPFHHAEHAEDFEYLARLSKAGGAVLFLNDPTLMKYRLNNRVDRTEDGRWANWQEVRERVMKDYHDE